MHFERMVKEQDNYTMIYDLADATLNVFHENSNAQYHMRIPFKEEEISCFTQNTRFHTEFDNVYFVVLPYIGIYKIDTNLLKKRILVKLDEIEGIKVYALAYNKQETTIQYFANNIDRLVLDIMFDKFIKDMHPATTLSKKTKPTKKLYKFLVSREKKFFKLHDIKYVKLATEYVNNLKLMFVKNSIFICLPII